MTEVTLHTWQLDEAEGHVLPQDSNLVQPGGDTSGTFIGRAKHKQAMSGYTEGDNVCTTSTTGNADSTPKNPNEISSQDRKVNEMPHPSPVTGRSVVDLLTNSQNDDDDVRTLMRFDSIKDNARQQSLRNDNMDTRRRSQRVTKNRNLKTQTGVSNLEDNRYKILNLPKDETERMEPPTKPARRSTTTTSRRTNGLLENESHSANIPQTGQNQPPVSPISRYSMYENHGTPNNSHNQSYYDDYIYDDIGQEENLEELDSIPAMEDIPYALILTGVLDNTTIKKAVQKQQQRVALENIHKEAEIRHRRKEAGINKNTIPNRVADNKKQPGTYPGLHPKSPYESAHEVRTTLRDMELEHRSTHSEHVHDTDEHIQIQTDERQLYHNDTLLQQTEKDTFNSLTLLQQTDQDTFNSLGDAMQQFDTTCQDMQPERANAQTHNSHVHDRNTTRTNKQQLDKDENKELLTPNASATSDDLHCSTGKHSNTPRESDHEMTKTMDAIRPEYPGTRPVITLNSDETLSTNTGIHLDYRNEPPLLKSNDNFISTGSTSRKSADEQNDSLDETTPNEPRSSLGPHSNAQCENNIKPLLSNTEEIMSVDNKDDTTMITTCPSREESNVIHPASFGGTARPKSPTHYQETKEKTDTAISTSPTLYIKVQLLTSIPGSNKSKPPLHAKQSKLQSGENTDSSAVTNNHIGDNQKKVENNLNRKETDNEEFIRMKRLQRLTVESKNTEHQIEPKSPSKAKHDDVRTKAANSYDITTKPVKPKVFRKNMPLYEKPCESSEENTTLASVADGPVIGQANEVQASKGTKVPSAMKLLQNNTSGLTEERNYSKRPSDENEKPSAMKTLESKPRATNRSLLGENSDVESDYADQQALSSMLEFLVFRPNSRDKELSPEKKPATMRLLEKMQREKERSSRSEKDFSQSSVASFLTSMMSSVKQKSKQKELKVKNENTTPTKVTTNDAHINGGGTLAETMNNEVKQDSKSPVTGWNNSAMTVPEVDTSSTAKLRHEAFRILKLKESGNQPKCTACGRPDCEGQNISQMKTLVRMAKEIGYEIRDVSPDGNCMFEAVIDQLNMYGDYRFQSKSLRAAAVCWLVEHPCSKDGTHYSNFVSCEWELYLQKMIAEGEWGDHVILRALAEVVGHIIRIFRVHDDTSDWTTVEPSSEDVSKDGIHLVLGLVGEFHYTSLRPSDAAPSYVPPLTSGSEVSDLANMKDIKLEGGETLDMFQEDYIDPMSAFPVAHFSYLLKTVVPMKYVDDAAPYSSELICNVQDLNLGKECQFYSPAADGVYHPQVFSNSNSQGNTNAMFELMVFISPSDDKIPNVSSLFDSEKLHPGFVRFKSGSRDMNSPGCATALPNGASFSSYTSYVFTKMYSLLCKSWPDTAKSWISRSRPEGWPSLEVINSIVADGYTIVPYCHPKSSDPSNVWQILFVEAEHKLFREAISKYQKHCFIMFIALCVQTMYENKSISYRHFKNVFFYACERIPREYWEIRAGSCVLYMLDSLMTCVKAHNLPNYFIDTYNMIDHLTDSEIRDLYDGLLLLRSQPVLFLKDINGNLENNTLIDSIIERVSRDVPQFTQYRALKMAASEVFVPSTIELAKCHIKMQRYEHGFELLSGAFQERLSISTCDEMVSYQLFLFGAVSGLDLDSLVWFSAYTDRQLEGQLSKSLIRETCGDLVLTTIQTILPPDVCGSFANTEVPIQFAATPCSFCSSFVRFLFCIQKMSDVLLILQYCHREFVEKLKQTEYGHGATQSKFENFTEHNMFEIYTAMFYVNKKQGQLRSFQSVIREVQIVCERIGTRGAFACLEYIYKMLGDNTNMSAAGIRCEQLAMDENDQNFIHSFNHWPYRCTTSYQHSVTW